MFPDHIDVKLGAAIVASDPSSKKQVTNAAIATSASAALLPLGKVFLTISFGVTFPFHWPVTLGLSVTTLLVTTIALSVIYGVHHRSKFKSLVALFLKEYDLTTPASFGAVIKDIDAAIRWAVTNKYEGSLGKFLQKCKTDPRNVFAAICSGLQNTSKIKEDSNYRKLVWFLLETQSPEAVEAAIQKAVDTSYNGSFAAFAKACESDPFAAFHAILNGFDTKPTSDPVKLIELLLETHSPTEIAAALLKAGLQETDSPEKRLEKIEQFFQRSNNPGIGMRQLLKRSRLSKLDRIKQEAERKIKEGQPLETVQSWYEEECRKELAKSALRDLGLFPPAARGLVAKVATKWLSV